MHVVVVGGGWAGLSAAVTLCSHGIRVTLCESAPQLGGRARGLRWHTHTVDNGQHLLIGAYRATLSLLDTIGLDHRQLFQRQRLSLHLIQHGQPAIGLHTLRLPAPLHLIGGLMMTQGLNWRERWAALRFCVQLRARPPADDCSVADLLLQHTQPAALTTRLWEPLCLATLNTPIHIASARLFRRVLLDAFTGHAGNSDLLLPRTDLGRLLPEPATNYIKQRGGTVRCGSRVTELSYGNNRISSVRLDDATTLECDQLILAVPPYACGRLLAPLPGCQGLVDQLQQFTYSPICTVYLQYPESVQLPTALAGSAGTLTQWIFDRRTSGQPGLMAVIISADGPHVSLDQDALATAVQHELARMFPTWPTPLDRLVIREKRATFLSAINITRIRPQAHTKLPNLWLAGDHVATSYPATLEGAVLSGRSAAQALLAAAS